MWLGIKYDEPENISDDWYEKCLWRSIQHFLHDNYFMNWICWNHAGSTWNLKKKERKIQKCFVKPCQINFAGGKFFFLFFFKKYWIFYPYLYSLSVSLQTSLPPFLIDPSSRATEWLKTHLKDKRLEVINQQV